jgi:hypothetical protein
MRKAPRSGAFSIYPAAKLSRRSFHIPTRIILKFFPAFFRAEEIFPTRKLRLKLRSLLVQFHSTNRISRHNYSSHRICSSYPPPHSKVLSVLGPAQVTDPVHFPSQKILVYTKPPKKILLPPCTLYPPSPGTTTLILPYHTPRPMRLSRRSRRLLLFLALYLAFCLAAGIFVADGTLHPARRPQPPKNSTSACKPGFLELMWRRPHRLSKPGGRTGSWPLATGGCLSAFPVRPLCTISRRGPPDFSAHAIPQTEPQPSKRLTAISLQRFLIRANP